MFYHDNRILPSRRGAERRRGNDEVRITIHNGVAYATHDGVELAGDLYLPKDAKSVPALVAVHGGGWVTGARGVFKYWGDYLAARGIALFSISYRLAGKEKTFPEAVQDVLAGVQFLRGKAGAFGIDPARIGLLGASAGAHLSALAALGNKKFAGGYPRRSICVGRRRRKSADRRLWHLRRRRDVDRVSGAGWARQ